MAASLKKPVGPEAVLPGGSSIAANVVFDNRHPKSSDKHLEILRGLQQDQKYIDPKYFYDARGSELFEQITDLPEYYPHTYRATDTLEKCHRHVQLVWATLCTD